MIYLRLLKPEQWTKNLAIFIPVFFAGEIFNSSLYPQLVFAFIVFSLSASSIYIFNDIIDKPQDLLHPRKKLRPIASGAISTKVAASISIFLLFCVVALSIFIPNQIWKLLLLYVFININYTLYLKHIPIIDVSVISIGFIIRLLIGGLATGIFITNWLILMAFLLSMCLSLGKRREEILIAGENLPARKSLNGYTVEFLNLTITMMLGVTIVCYIIYCTSEEVMKRWDSEFLYVTAFLVIISFLRYLQIIIVEGNGGSPTDIFLRDRFIQIVLLLWVLTFYFLLYVS